MDNFKASYSLLFRQRALFNTLISYRRLRQRELRTKIKLTRKFDTGQIAVVRKQINLSRKNRVSQKFLLKTKRPYRVLEKATPRTY